MKLKKKENKKITLYRRKKIIDYIYIHKYIFNMKKMNHIYKEIVA